MILNDWVSYDEMVIEPVDVFPKALVNRRSIPGRMSGEGSDQGSLPPADGIVADAIYPDVMFSVVPLDPV